MSGFCPNHKSIRQTFFIFDYIMGALFIVYFLIYSIPTIIEMKNQPPILPTAKVAQITFMSALLIKGLGITFSGIGIQNQWDFGAFSLFTNGLPGYVIATAYCYVFFSWCSVCVQFTNKDSKSFFKKSTLILRSIIIIIWIGFVITGICVSTLSCKRQESSARKAHYIEATIASIRDIIITIAFIVYLIKVSRIFGPLRCNFRLSEIRLISVSSLLTLAVFYRAFTIEFYTYYWSSSTGLYSQSDTNKYKLECSIGYFINYSFDQVLMEFFPLLSIGLMRFIQIRDNASHSLSEIALAPDSSY